MAVDVLIKPFSRELDFEAALTKQLTEHGWEPAIIMNPTEQNLIDNWAAILYNNNRDVTRLGDFPLTKTEMDQVINQVNKLKTPYERNKFINGGLVCIKRDNPNDHINFGKEVYLKIFDAREIRAGQSVYQIVRQPKFETRHKLASERRGDVMLLINGMPMIHIELKRSGVDITQAVNQIKRYTHDGIFSQGIFSLVQVFLAMTPEKTLYFANPGSEENFKSNLWFHWADFNNEETHDWKAIARNLINIPMAHQLIGYYTIADDKDETLKVLRSYQYFATCKICDRVHETNWDDHKHKGGFVWHTTGSGKTMTSFKAAQLIANSGDADKVVFLLDRIELGIQSLDEYRGFAGEHDNVQDSDNTADLIKKLESDDKDDCLIVTSLQKMSRVNHENNVADSTLKKIGDKRVVFIVDECHRGVYGSMLMSIKKTFPRALLFGFTGTPVFEENARGELTTEVIFGDELHKYTLVHGIPDGNVLGFDIYGVETFDERDMRKAVALNELDIQSEEEIGDDEEKKVTFNKYLHDVDILKIEDMAKSLYSSDNHHNAVVQKIVEERPMLSKNGKFHAILATKNIPEAIAYYNIFKEKYPQYNVAAIFDDSIDNNGKGEYKEDAILEILEDYNNKFDTHFQQSTYAKYKKDVAKRLAHKNPYKNLPKDKQLDLLIVVTQMLTGYDSAWVNTLYVDKLLYYVDVIQAFSRTNRLFGPDKPFGTIKYFDRPNKMKKNIEDALALYADQPMLVFTDKLEVNLENINKEYLAIKTVFEAEGIEYFDRIPQAKASKNKFASEFCSMTKHIEAAKMQGFDWDIKEYEFMHTQGWVKLKMEIDEQTYGILLQRYRELFEDRTGGSDGGDDDVYQLEAYITETGVGTINADYINNNFIKFVKNLYTTGPGSDFVKAAQQELNKSFASLSQRDQRTATRILHDIQSGDLHLSPNKTIYDYILDYQKLECDQQIYTLSEATGLNINKLKDIITKDVNEQNINDQGRFDDLMSTLDKVKGVDFIKKVLNKEVKKMFMMSTISNLIRRFILNPDDRAKILFAYQNANAVLDVNIPDELPEEEEETPEQTAPVVPDKEKVRTNISNVLKSNLSGVAKYMRSEKEVIDSVFYVMKTKSIDSLDGVGNFIDSALNTLFGKTPTIVEKHIAFNLLVTKFEAYLKKLYYLMTGHEVNPQYEGDDVTWKDVIYSIRPLWGLKNNRMTEYQNLYQYLLSVKAWRNNEAHVSPTASDQEINAAINIVVSMYFYATGSCITDLECNGHDVEDIED